MPKTGCRSQGGLGTCRTRTTHSKAFRTLLTMLAVFFRLRIPAMDVHDVMLQQPRNCILTRASQCETLAKGVESNIAYEKQVKTLIVFRRCRFRRRPPSPQPRRRTRSPQGPTCGCASLTSAPRDHLTSGGIHFRFRIQGRQKM